MNQAEVLKTAMKHIDRALNELDTVCPYYSNDYEALHRAKKALRQVLEKFANLTTGVVESKALAQPEQEPVAVWKLEEDGWNTIADPDWMETLPVGTLLYTAPPKREWVDLDEEEQKECWDEGGSQWAIYQNIASKLKEKNT